MSILQVIQGYPGAELVWCQEEPKNMGAWTYVKPRLETALRNLTDCAIAPNLHYVGRPSAASTGDLTFRAHTGIYCQHIIDHVSKYVHREASSTQSASKLVYPPALMQKLDYTSRVNKCTAGQK